MTSKGRVLHVITGLLQGGAEILLLDITSRLVQRGWEISVLCFRKDLLAPAYRQRGVRVISLDLPKGDPRIIWRVRNWVHQSQPDVVHVHLFEAEFMTTLALLDNSNVPMICTRLGLDDFRMKSVNRLANALVNRRSRYVIAASDIIGDVLYHRERLAPSKILRIWNAVDSRRFPVVSEPERRDMRTRYDLDTAEGVVGSVGRLSPEKGHRYLLEAWPTVLQAFPKAVLIIIGTGDLRGALQVQSQRLGISSGVRFLGSVQDGLEELLACFDVFVLPSLHEGLPIALIEAMATGLSVVATGVGGVPDLVSNDTGILVPPADPAALAQAMTGLLKDPERRQRMGHAGRQVAEKRFDIEQAVENLSSVYEAVIDNTLPNVELRYSPEKQVRIGSRADAHAVTCRN